MSDEEEAQSAPEQRPVDQSHRPDPWKGFRGICSGVLILEAITVLLGVPVVVNFSDPGWLPTAFVLGYSALLILSCGVQSRPWALGWDIGLQFVLVAGWFLHPAVGAVGVIFLLVWVIVWWAQRSVKRALSYPRD